MILRLLSLLLLVPFTIRAIDVESSKPVPQTVSPSTTTSHKKFSIFSGDPDRIQRANEVDYKTVVCKLESAPNPFSFGVAGSLTASPELTFTLSVKNEGKRGFTLSFPNTQRYNLTITNASGEKIYDWSTDKEFVDVVGSVMVNPTDRIAYRVKLNEDDFGRRLPAGSYTAEMSVANYPDLKAQISFKIR